jgi:uncharacterized protein YhbP (UPF0306 family)
MNKVDKRIIEFIGEHHVLTLATSCDNKPYCAHCFYVFLEEKNMFIFTSDKSTKHIQDLGCQNHVAGAIALETKTVGKIRGLQLTGVVKELLNDEYKTAKHAYLKAFPFAILKKTELWGLEVEFFKMTDNRFGFGKKLLWEKLTNN